MDQIFKGFRSEGRLRFTMVFFKFTNNNNEKSYENLVPISSCVHDVFINIMSVISLVFKRHVFNLNHHDQTISSPF